MWSRVNLLVELTEFLQLKCKGDQLTNHEWGSLSSSLLSASIQDCYCRFILNVPQNYLTNTMHICFAVQEAYWWYEDFWYDSFASLLPKMSMRQFGILLFNRCPLLRLYFAAEQYDTFMTAWREHCRKIPLKGAILLNNTLTKVLMVQGWKQNHWMFPRGKVDEYEEDICCAIREVKEELGVDICQYINSKMYIEANIKDQSIKLFVVPGILETTHFEPRKRKEIGQISWIPLEAIPGWKRFSSKKADRGRRGAMNNENFTSLRFWNVFPFMKALAGWVHLIQLTLHPKTSSYPTLTVEGSQHQESQVKDNFEKASPFTSLFVNVSHSKNQLERPHPHKQSLKMEKLFYLPSLIQRQPAEAKPSPRPPLVDSTYESFKLENISPHILQELQHPLTEDHGDVEETSGRHTLLPASQNELCFSIKKTLERDTKPVMHMGAAELSVSRHRLLKSKKHNARSIHQALESGTQSRIEPNPPHVVVVHVPAPTSLSPSSFSTSSSLYSKLPHDHLSSQKLIGVSTPFQNTPSTLKEIHDPCKTASLDVVWNNSQEIILDKNSKSTWQGSPSCVSQLPVDSEKYDSSIATLSLKDSDHVDKSLHHSECHEGPHGMFLNEEQATNFTQEKSPASIRMCLRPLASHHKACSLHLGDENKARRQCTQCHGVRSVQDPCFFKKKHHCCPYTSSKFFYPTSCRSTLHQHSLHDLQKQCDTCVSRLVLEAQRDLLNRTLREVLKTLHQH